MLLHLEIYSVCLLVTNCLLAAPALHCRHGIVSVHCSSSWANILNLEWSLTCHTSGSSNLKTALVRFGRLFRGRQMFTIKDDEGGAFSHQTMEMAFVETLWKLFSMTVPASLVLHLSQVTRYHVEERPWSAWPQVDAVEMLAAAFMSYLLASMIPCFLLQNKSHESFSLDPYED